MSALRLFSAVAALLIVANAASAQMFTGNLNLVSANSNLVVSGNLNGPLGTTNYAQQGTGGVSLTTSYTGNINVILNLSSNTIQFTNVTLSTANNSGSWIPQAGGVAGSAPANYGVHIPYAFNTIPIDAALRALTFSITSAPLTLTGGGSSRTFPPTQTFLANTGSLDFLASLGAGSSSMAGNTGNNVSASTGTLTLLGGSSFQLSFPIDMTIVEAFTVTGFGNFTATTRFQGTFLSSGTLTAVPEPTTYALIGASLIIGIYIYHRRRCQWQRMNDKSLSANG